MGHYKKMALRRGTEQQPYLVTTAPQSPAEEIDARQRRYLWTMGARVVCFIAAIALYEFLPAIGPIKLVVAGLAMVLPWIAVVAANAGPTRKPGLPSTYAPPPQPAIEAPPQPDASSSPSPDAP